MCWAGETDPDGEKTEARFRKHEEDKDEALRAERQLNAARETPWSRLNITRKAQCTDEDY